MRSLVKHIKMKQDEFKVSLLPTHRKPSRPRTTLKSHSKSLLPNSQGNTPRISAKQRSKAKTPARRLSFALHKSVSTMTNSEWSEKPATTAAGMRIRFVNAASPSSTLKMMPVRLPLNSSCERLSKGPRVGSLEVPPLAASISSEGARSLEVLVLQRSLVEGEGTLFPDFLATKWVAAVAQPHAKEQIVKNHRVSSTRSSLQRKWRRGNSGIILIQPIGGNSKPPNREHLPSPDAQPLRCSWRALRRRRRRVRARSRLHWLTSERIPWRSEAASKAKEREARELKDR